MTAGTIFGWGLVAGCAGNQSALDSAGPQAARIARLWYLNLGVAVVVYVVMVALITTAIVRRRRQRKSAVNLAPPPAQERQLTRRVSAAVGLTVLILFLLLIADYSTGRSIHSLQGPDPLKIRVTGHQWWWEVRYDDPEPSRLMTTANEIHIPVAPGHRVRAQLGRCHP